MMLKPKILFSAVALSISACISAPFALADSAEQKQIAMDAYVYGYSLLTSEVTRVQMTNVAKAEGLHAPMDQFINVKRYPPGDFRGVSAPNADTLYSLAWIDLSEPKVFSQPDMGDRYFLMPMYNLWMIDFQSPGTRTTGGKAHNFLLTGPGWKGEVPKNMTQIKVATRYMVILGRIYSTGTEEDYNATNALQNQLSIVPLSQIGNKGYQYKAPPVDPNPGFSMTEKPQEVLLAMDSATYFNKMATLMCKDSPPAAEDAPMLAKMAKIGLEPCKVFDQSKLPKDVQASLVELPKQALAKIDSNRSMMGKPMNGWIATMGVGVYGTDYLKRAVVAAFGWPANLEQDAVYPFTDQDSNGEKLNGKNNYTLTFAKGLTPPVNAFWSITMYEVDQGWWFVPNPLNKFTVSPRNNLKQNPNGSTTLYFQHENPGKDKEANWLPAPKGDFLLMMRMYWPKENTPSILNGTWMPPKIIKSK